MAVMARKNADGRMSGAGRGPGAEAEPMFGDKRSGQDRRADGEPIAENRRKAGDRRKPRTGTQVSWWLERGYVESHHFVQKSTGSRNQTPDDESSRE